MRFPLIYFCLFWQMQHYARHQEAIRAKHFFQLQVEWPGSVVHMLSRSTLYYGESAAPFVAERRRCE